MQSIVVDINRLKTPISNDTCKATTVLRREGSKAKELLLQHVLAAYQEALMSEVLSVHEAACHFNVPKTMLQECING